MFGLFKKSQTSKIDYLEEVNNAIDEIFATGKASVDDVPPFRMKAGEQFICSIPATLGTYKNDGRISSYGFTGSVKIAKGVRFRVGTGRVGMGKSWVFDQPGTIHITSERIVFNGVNKNNTVQFTKVINMAMDTKSNILYIDRESGADWAFKVQAWPEAKQMATAFMFQRGMIET